MKTLISDQPAVAIVIAVALLVAGCHHRSGESPTGYPCPESRAADGAPFDSADGPSLAGRYRITTVNTARRWPRDSTAAVILLNPNDTLQRFYRPGLGRLRRFGDRPVAGRYEHGTHRDTVEVEGRMLYVGCRNCFDGSPTHYTIQGWSPHAFWGTWVNYQTGLAQAADARGRPLPDPEGLFCAVRMS